MTLPVSLPFPLNEQVILVFFVLPALPVAFFLTSCHRKMIWLEVCCGREETSQLAGQVQGSLPREYSLRRTLNQQIIFKKN